MSGSQLPGTKRSPSAGGKLDSQLPPAPRVSTCGSRDPGDSAVLVCRENSGLCVTKVRGRNEDRWSAFSTGI